MNKVTVVFAFEKCGLFQRIVADVPECKNIPLPKEAHDLVAKGWQLRDMKYVWESRGKKPKKSSGGKKPKKSSGGHDKNKLSHKMSQKRFNANPPKWQGDEQKCASIIARILGDGPKSPIKERYNVDALGLATARLKGENPLDYLAKPVDTSRRATLLVSPDLSGSCTSFSDFTVAFSIALSKIFDVYYVENVNGFVNKADVPMDVDLLLYIGDEDIVFCSKRDDLLSDDKMSLYNLGKKLIVLDNHASNYASPKLFKKYTTKERAWITHVSLKDTKNYIAALEIAARHFSQ